MQVGLEVLYNAESRRFTLLDTNSGNTKQCTATTARALIDLYGKPIRKYFTNRKDVTTYMKKHK